MSSDLQPSSAVRAAPAASLILLRDWEGLEVLVGRRTLTTRAFPGATVFPGGRLEAEDRQWPGADGLLAAARYTALRETFEETGLLITASGEPLRPDTDLLAARADIEAGAVTFSEWVARRDVVLGPNRLTPFAHWVTPALAPYRFDTLFFLVEVSKAEGDAPLIWAEFEQLGWARPQELLDSTEARLMTPTRHCLEVVAASPTPAHAIEAAQARGMIDGHSVREMRRATETRSS